MITNKRHIIFFIGVLFSTCLSSIDSLDYRGIKKIEDWLKYDSTGISGVLSNRTEQIFAPEFFSQNLGGIRNNFNPDFSIHSFGSPLWFRGLDLNTVLDYSDSTRTIASYQFGFDDVHDFKAKYSDKIYGTYLNVDFERLSAVSKYNNSDNKNFKFLVNAETKEGRVQQRYGFYRNSNTLQHNGGVWSQALLDSAEELSQFGIPTRLNNANSSYSDWGIYLGNTWHLNYSKPEIDSVSTAIITDSLSVDSAGADSVGQMREEGFQHYIGYLFALRKEEFIFSMDQGDIDSMFLSPALIDQSNTWDSLGFQQRFISVDYTLKNKEKHIELTLGAQGERYDYDLLNRSWVHADFQIGNNYRVRGNGRYYFDGIWDGGYEAKTSFNTNVTRDLIIDAFVELDKKRPGYLHMKFQGNHYQWDQNLDAANRQSAGLRIFHKKLGLSLEGELSLLNDWLYYDTLSNPVQFDGEIAYKKLELKHQWQNRHLRLYTLLRYQGSSSTKLRIPELLAQNTFAYYFKLGELNFTTGLITTYFTSYNPMAYNPNLRAFYLQEDYTANSLPIVTAFASVRIGGADIFLKGENLLFDTVSREFYLYPYMTTVPRFVRVGFNWRFKN